VPVVHAVYRRFGHVGPGGRIYTTTLLFINKIKLEYVVVKFASWKNCWNSLHCCFYLLAAVISKLQMSTEISALKHEKFLGCLA
jgi:hypothetical protein